MPTMHQVAAKAGVSPTTVSYVLSGLRPVSEATRAKVMSAIDELGYTLNAAARTLALQRTKVIAMVYPVMDTDLSTVTQSFIIAASATARKYGYDFVLWPFDKDAAKQIVSLARRGMADGCIVMEVAVDDKRISALQNAEFPFTMIGRTKDLTNRPWVDMDFDGAVRTAVQRLTGLGHRHIAFINRSEAAARTGYAPVFRTEQAFQREMKASGLDPVSFRCDESSSGGAKAAERLLRDHPEITAVILMNKFATFGFLEELHSRGLEVPRDISVMTIMSSPEVAATTNPKLVSLAVPGQELGTKAALTLLHQLGVAVPEVTEPLVACVEIPGDSIAPPPN